MKPPAQFDINRNVRRIQVKFAFVFLTRKLSIPGRRVKQPQSRQERIAIKLIFDLKSIFNLSLNSLRASLPLHLFMSYTSTSIMYVATNSFIERRLNNPTVERNEREREN